MTKKRMLTEQEIYEQHVEKVAKEYKMKLDDPMFWSIYKAAETAVGNNGHRSLEHWFEVFHILMTPSR